MCVPACIVTLRLRVCARACVIVCMDAVSRQLLVREAECHDKLAALYLQQHRNSEAKREQVVRGVGG